MRAPRREVLQTAPLNAEMPLAALVEPVTPTPLFYVRNHFDIPRIDPAAWTLELSPAAGDSRRSRVSLEMLRSLPRRTMTVTMECAGNGRALLTPPPPGTPWHLGAVSTARFTGAPLVALLERFPPAAGTVELLFAGADRGTVEDGRELRYERSLPLNIARDPDVLLAWEMNDAPLPPEHGAPVRLVVPRWYGMASVKWLASITALAVPFAGYFQAEHYVYRDASAPSDGTPVTRTRVRSLIAAPHDGAELRAAEIAIRGAAWSGDGAITRVRVSTNAGASWEDATLDAASSPLAMTPWHLRWTPPGPGEHTILARATDETGAEQPLRQVWNTLGYGNNAVQHVRVQVVE